MAATPVSAISYKNSNKPTFDQKSNDKNKDKYTKDKDNEDEIEYSWVHDGFKYPDQKLKPIKTMQQFHARFQIGPLLGGGGDGDVYEAANKSWAAIKKIRLYDDQDTELELVRNQQEQRLLSSASLANIYGIYYDEYKNKSTGKLERIIYKVYDRYNWPLDDLIIAMKDIRMTEHQIKHIIYDVCKQIKSLHRAGFIHLDIKPSNILYCKNGTFKKNYKDAGSFKLIDFDGCIWNRTVDEDGEETLNEGVEMAWQGTFCWTAPEMNDYVEETNLISYAADIWSIGLVILYIIHKGNLGLMDVADEEIDRFHQCYETCDAHAIKGEIFDDWYEDKFGQDQLFRTEIERLYERNRISKSLYSLLKNGIFIRDPEERYSIQEVLDHPWFNDVDNKYRIVNIHNKTWDYYDALMYEDKDGNKIYNAHIRFIQSTYLPSDDEGSEDEKEATDDEDEDDDEEESEYEDETETDSEEDDDSDGNESASPNPPYHNDEQELKEEQKEMKGVRIHINTPGHESRKAFLPYLKATNSNKSNSKASISSNNHYNKGASISPYLQVTPSKNKIEESPEIRFFSDEEEEEEDDQEYYMRQQPNVSRYNSSEYYTNSSIASGSESDDELSKRILGTRSRPRSRRVSATKQMMMRISKRRSSF